MLKLLPNEATSYVYRNLAPNQGQVKAVHDSCKRRDAQNTPRYAGDSDCDGTRIMLKDEEYETTRSTPRQTQR